MKIRVVGGPVTGNVTVDVKHSDRFSDVFKKIQKAVGDAELWSKFQAHSAVMVTEDGTRRVRPLPHVIQPEETPKSLSIPKDTLAFIMLRPLGSAPPDPLPETGVTGESVSPGRQMSQTPTRAAPPGGDGSAASGAPNLNPGASYRERLVAIYTKYQPEKLHTINGTLKKFAGKEEAVIKQLTTKYGPEPRIDDVAGGQSSGDVGAESPGNATTMEFSPVRGPSASVEATPRAQDRGQAKPADESPAAVNPYAAPASPLDQQDGSSTTLTPELTPRDNTSASLSPVSAAAASANAAYSYKDRMTAIYLRYDADKVPLVDGNLRKFSGREEAVIRSLVKKYGPEPVIGVDVRLPGADAPAAPELARAPSAPSPVNSPVGVPNAAGSPLAKEESNSPADAQQPYRERLVAIYTKYHPEKLNTVEGNLKRFIGREEAMIQKLVDRYGPEPVQTAGASAAAAAPAGNAGAPPPTQVPAPTPDAATPSPTTAAGSVLREKITAFLQAHDPDRLPQVDRIVEQYRGREEEAMERLQQMSEKLKGNAESDDQPVATEIVTPREHAGVEQVPSAPEPKVAEMSAAPREVKPATPPATPAVTGSPPNPVELGKERSPVAATPTVTEPSPTDSTPPATAETVAETVQPTNVPRTLASTPPPDAEDQKKPSVDAPVPSAVAPTAVPVSPVKAAPAAPVSPVKAAPAAPVSPVKVSPAAPVSPVKTASLAPASPVKTVPAALGHKCADFLAKQHGETLRRQYFKTWLDFRDEATAQEVFAGPLWEKRGSGRYQLADTVEPPYVVSDKVGHVRDLRRSLGNGDGVLSDALVLSLRTVIDALKSCLRSQAIDITSEEETELVNVFLREWESEEDLCPVRDTEKLSHALQQAARFLYQIEDLMKVASNQDTQIEKLKDMHEKLQQRDEDNQSMEMELKNLVEQLNESKRREKSLQEALDGGKGTSTSAGRSARQHSPGVTPRDRQRMSSRGAASRGSRASSTAAKSRPSTEVKQEAQIVRLQQELAKTRSQVNRSKAFEDKLKQQLEESEERQMRLRRVLAATADSPQRGRSSSARGRSTERQSDPSQARTPRGYAGVRRSSLGLAQRAAFSEPQQLTPRRGGAGTVLDKDEQLSHGNSTSPWPKSRYAPPVPEIDRGPCPNCLTELTSISPDIVGPANERAAFCFSCRRSFTFAELEHRDAASQGGRRDTILSDLYNSR